MSNCLFKNQDNMARINSPSLSCFTTMTGNFIAISENTHFFSFLLGGKWADERYYFRNAMMKIIDNDNL